MTGYMVGCVIKQAKPHRSPLCFTRQKSDFLQWPPGLFLAWPPITPAVSSPTPPSVLILLQPTLVLFPKYVRSSPDLRSLLLPLPGRFFLLLAACMHLPFIRFCSKATSSEAALTIRSKTLPSVALHLLDLLDYFS